MITYTVAVDRMFNGQITSHQQHNVTTLVGLVRILRWYPQGQGHGIRLTVPYDCALGLGIAESCGYLWADALELCVGDIDAPPELR